MNEPRITIVVQENCRHCHELLSKLTKLGIEQGKHYKLTGLRTDPSIIELARQNKVKTTPFLVISYEDGQCVIPEVAPEPTELKRIFLNAERVD